MSAHRKLPRALAGELLGTYLLVLFGTGSVAAAVLTNAQMGLWQVAVVWGFGVTLAIYASATLSGAHLNPAVSLAFALLRRDNFPFVRLFPLSSRSWSGRCSAVPRWRRSSGRFSCTLSGPRERTADEGANPENR